MGWKRRDHRIGGARVTIRLKNGETVSEKIKHVVGHPQNPMSYEQVAEKFLRCVRFSAKPIPKEKATLIIEKVRVLEEVVHINDIIGLLD